MDKTRGDIQIIYKPYSMGSDESEQTTSLVASLEWGSGGPCCALCISLLGGGEGVMEASLGS